MKRFMAGLILFCLIMLAVTSEFLIAPAVAGDRGKTYYLSSSTYTGSAARTACVRGFHMASLFELSSLGALTYLTRAPSFTSYADQGQGPPNDVWGWIHAGSQVDCSNYYNGGIAEIVLPSSLPNEYTTTTWDLNFDSCTAQYRVWCVSNSQ